MHKIREKSHVDCDHDELLPFRMPIIKTTYSLSPLIEKTPLHTFYQKWVAWQRCRIISI